MGVGTARRRRGRRWRRSRFRPRLQRVEPIAELGIVPVRAAREPVEFAVVLTGQHHDADGSIPPQLVQRDPDSLVHPDEIGIMLACFDGGLVVVDEDPTDFTATLYLNPTNGHKGSSSRWRERNSLVS